MSYELVDSFYIDDNELCLIASETAFVLGVEFEHFRSKLNALEDTVYITHIHRENADRCSRAASRRGRKLDIYDVAGSLEWLLVVAQIKPMLRLVVDNTRDRQ
jgi:hypothetical protein